MLMGSNDVIVFIIEFEVILWGIGFLKKGLYLFYFLYFVMYRVLFLVGI